MLIEFRVTNYRSICETQSLSVVASRYYKGLEEQNCFDAGVGGLPALLRSAVVYGANAAGKSNLIRAMHFMKSFVLTSHSHQEGQQINLSPFRLNIDSRGKPAEFEAVFVEDGVRYQYGFAANRERVTQEWLIAYPEGKPQRWFERRYDEEGQRETWRFGSKFTGRKQLWQEATRKNALFLSTAIQLNNEQLKPVFGWFQQKLAVILPGDPINLQFSIDQCGTDEGRTRIMDFMNSADLGIVGIKIKKTLFSQEMLPRNVPQEWRDRITKDLSGKDIPSILFQHLDNRNEPVYFDLVDESDGTIKLFAFAGPWLDVVTKGRVLFVDELDTSLHPLLVRHLIELVQNRNVNARNAQLILTTHDTSLLDADLFRRDQVWFVEKDRDNATRLYPLSDFSARKNEALGKRYLKGRYGALPHLGDPRFYGVR